ncbi:MAG TPA: DUF1302 family protein [Rhodocyclaceae bacterium]|nr:DUF1302 family protein [Rhodocyclaceae bacterium]
MNRRRNAGRRRVDILSTAVLVALAQLGAGSAQAAETNFYGDVSAALSWNTQDTLKDNKGFANTLPDTKGKMSMQRYTARLNVDSTVNENLSWAGKLRLVHEADLGYLKKLEDIRGLGFSGADSAGHNDLSRMYSWSELRELYADIKPTENILLRLGKQQVVWGESDFFQAMDMVHGYDFTWRSFLEPANEELRKPLVLANLTVQVPEADGKVQVLFRPGSLNRLDAIGNTYDIRGGRWANQPLKGVDFTAITPYNYRAEGADARKNTWGIRWSGLAREINYSLSYLKTFNPSPVISMAPQVPIGLIGNLAPIPTGSVPFNQNYTGVAGEVVYPKVDMFGVTASGYSATADAVFSTEVAYVRDFAYNFGQNSFWSLVLGGPGYDGVKRKNVVRSMVRMDKSLPFTQSLLGTEKPAFFSVQVFDTWIRNFKESEDLVQLVGFGQRSAEHSTLMTVILDTSYVNGTVNPTLVLGSDLTYGGGFAVPSVTLQYGKNWRLKLEYDHFWHKGARSAANDNVERNGSLFGYFANNNQFYAKLTYQF